MENIMPILQQAITLAQVKIIEPSVRFHYDTSIPALTVDNFTQTTFKDFKMEELDKNNYFTFFKEKSDLAPGERLHLLIRNYYNTHVQQNKEIHIKWSWKRRYTWKFWQHTRTFRVKLGKYAGTQIEFKESSEMKKVVKDAGSGITEELRQISRLLDVGVGLICQKCDNHFYIKQTRYLGQEKAEIKHCPACGNALTP